MDLEDKEKSEKNDPDGNRGAHEQGALYESQRQGAEGRDERIPARQVSESLEMGIRQDGHSRV